MAISSLLILAALCCFGAGVGIAGTNLSLIHIFRHSTIGREKSSVCEDDSALMQKFFTKQSFVDVLPVKPDRKIHIKMCIRDSLKRGH